MITTNKNWRKWGKSHKSTSNAMSNNWLKYWNNRSVSWRLSCSKIHKCGKSQKLYCCQDQMYVARGKLRWSCLLFRVLGRHNLLLLAAFLYLHCPLILSYMFESLSLHLKFIYKFISSADHENSSLIFFLLYIYTVESGNSKLGFVTNFVYWWEVFTIQNVVYVIKQ